jgi:Ino eighty subunit 2
MRVHILNCTMLTTIQMDTINKLLKKQAPKTNARRREFNPSGSDATPDVESLRANPLFVRWISRKDGNCIGVPEEWLEGPVGAVFQGGVKQSRSAMNGKLTEELS